MTPAAAARSYLYVPGDRPERLATAHTRGADAIVADLEDAVAPASKEAARKHVAEWLSSTIDDASTQRWVRINAESIEDDLNAVVSTSLTGVFVPKSDPAQLVTVDAILRGLEADRGLADGSVSLLPMIESGLGVQQLPEIATSARVLRLGVGEADLAADLGLILDEDRSILMPLRLQVVVASAAAGIARPIGPTSTAFRDLDSFRRSGEVLRRLGFRGRTAIHPGQIPVIHEVFTPTEEEIAAARAMLAHFEAAGGGGSVGADGRFIDLAVVRNAREVLALAGEA